MLFEEFVEQHRVHCLIAHRVRLALVITRDERGADLLYLLGHEAELRDARRVKLVFIAEGHRFKRENRFARLVHRPNAVFETFRGDDRAEVTVGIDNDSNASCNG